MIGSTTLYGAWKIVYRSELSIIRYGKEILSRNKKTWFVYLIGGLLSEKAFHFILIEIVLGLVVIMVW